MPEIPEMEIYKTFLQNTVVGKAILETSINRERSINVEPETFKQSVQGARIEQVTRAGKYLICTLNNGLCLVAHMMLDGRIYLELEGTPAEYPGKPHVSLVLEDKSIVHFCELRLGYLKLLPSTEVADITRSLGIDPLSTEFTLTGFLQVINPKKGMIKPLLMDQKVIAGIGNAYSNESLFAASILPERKVTTLTTEEKAELFQSILGVLRLGIEKGGYIEEKFAHWDNLSGGIITYFKVYARQGQPCLRCNHPIEQKTVGGRNAFFCPNCQH